MIPGISQPAASVTLYHQNFDTDPDPLNFFYAEGVVFPSDYGYAYFHPAGSQPLRLLGFLAEDVTAEALFLTTDEARVTVRRSGTDHYSAIMAGSGEVALYRNESVIATGLSTEPYDPLGWRKITLSAEAVTGAAILRVSINDEEIITFSDPQPLAAGNVEFGMVSDGMIDNVQINIPSQETEVSSSAFSAFSTASSGYYPFNVDNLEFAFENAGDSSILYYDRTEPSVARLNYLTSEQSGTFATFDTSAFEVLGEIIPSPDGSQGVYVCRSYSVSTQLLCLADFTTGDVVTIATTIPGAEAPVWSPDGLTVLYASPAVPTPELKQIDVTTNTSQSTPLRCIDFDWAGAYIFCLTATALTAYQADDPDWIPIPVLSGVSLKNFDAVFTYNGIGITYEELTPIPTNAGVITTLGWGNVLTSDMSWVPGNIVTVNTPNITSFPDGSRLFKWTSYERPTWSPDGRNILYFAVDYSHLCEEENGQPTFCYLVRADKVALYNGLLASPESQSFSSYELTQEQGLLAPDTLFISSFNTYKLFFRWAQVQLPTPTPTIEYLNQFRGIIFWAIYNETNENQQIPLYEALPGVETSIPNSITDRDHRYLMARTILNNIPLDDISGGVAFMRRWGGSIGSTDYRLWIIQLGRVECEFQGEPIALSYALAASESNEAILHWFNGYMECLRGEQPLGNRIPHYDEAYSDITGFIDSAIDEFVNGAPNPVPGAEFVKHTSTCFVWQRDTNGQITSCYGNQGRVDMQVFCQQAPTGRLTTVPNRNCRASSINPNNVDSIAWLSSNEGRDSNQQLGLETVVRWRNLINLGLYIPDQPLLNDTGNPTSGQGCENNCYFLLGNPILSENMHLRELINDDEPRETRAEAWERHEALQMHPDYGYRGNAQGYLMSVLRIEDSGFETWITTVFQQGAN